MDMETKEHIVNETSYSVSLDTVIFISSLLITGALLFLLVYFVITLSDLECDYLNAQQCCYRLNMWVIPKLISHVLLTIIFGLSGHYLLFLASIPLLIYIANEYRKVPAGNFGVYDPIDILKYGYLKAHMRDALIGILYYLISFFIYLYCLLTHILRSTSIPKPTYNDDSGL